MHSDGDGKDIVSGFDSKDTLQILDGEFTYSVDGNDVVVKVGEGSVTLKNTKFSRILASDAKGKLTTLNADWSVGTGTDDDDNIVNNADNVTILALAGNDFITNNAVQVFIDGGAGKDTLWNYADNITMYGGAGDDAITNDNDNVSINGGEGNDNIVNGGVNATITGGVGKDTISLINYLTDTKKVTLTDFSEEDIITLSDSVKAISFDETDKTLKIDDKWIAYLPNSTSSATWKVEDSAVSYMPEQNLQFVLAKDGKSITCTETTTAQALTITGLKSDLTVVDGKIDGISLTDKMVKLSASVLDEKEVTISEGYTLALADDVTQPETGEPSWSIADNVATYKAGDTTSGYTLADNKISYAEAKVGENLVTVSGIKSLDGLTLNGKVVTVAESSLNDVDVTISAGYTLALATEVTKPVINNPSWSVTNGTATCQGNRTAGYTLENNKIVYHAAVTDEDRIEGRRAG